MLTNLDKSQFKIAGEVGLPEHYPIPNGIDNLLFYIQRNLNKNTVVYALNFNQDGTINENFPMNLFWIKYTQGGSREELNFIQTKAFGYSSKKINNVSFEFQMDSYPALRFFVGKDINENYQVYMNVEGYEIILSNIYVYANEFGLFPKVEYIELYGVIKDSKFPCYKKIVI